MAKATARCTCKTCGNTFVKETYKSSRAQADSWVEWALDYYDICPECELEAQKNQAAEYAKEASDGGLPTLRGSEKQVTWAEKIRHDKIDAINGLISDAISAGDGEVVANIELTLAYISTKDQARWWIDNRDCSAKRLLGLNFRDAQEARMENPVKEPRERPESNTVITPENAQYGTVEIVVSENSVEAYYPKDDTFRRIIKDAGFSWNSDLRCWNRQITQTTGNSVDRAADVSNRLLAAGFLVSCKNDDVRLKAVSGDFELECKRWIRMRIAGEYQGWMSIGIPRDDPDSQALYGAARKIKGSKWSSGSVVVPIAMCDMVEDFADIYGYNLADATKKAIEEYRSTLTVTAKSPVAAEKKDVLGDILKSSADVLPDLRDD